MNTIEIFPQESGCPAGCSLCSLGNNTKKTQNKKEVDKNIILTFKLIEEIFYKNNLRYWIPYAGHINSLFDNLSEMITYPELLLELRPSLEHKIDLKNPIEHLNLIKDQYEKLKNKFDKLELMTLGLTMTPQNPYKLDYKEKKFINKYFDFLYNDMFKDRPYINFEIEVHSNMVASVDLYENNAFLNKNDDRFMKSLEKTIIDREILVRVTNWKDEELGKYFLSYHSMKSFRNENGVNFVYMNRILAPRKNDKLSVSEFNLEQAKDLLDETNNEFNVSLTPQGVMLKHSSLRINNPVIWFEHDDFRKAVSSLIEKGKTILEIQQILLDQNYNLMIDNPNLVNYRKSMNSFSKLRYQKFKEIYE